MSKYKQFTKQQRFQLEALLKAGNSQKKTAELLGFHRSTIYREIKRNKSARTYLAGKAQELSHQRKERFQRKRKWSAAMETFIDEKLGKEQWSPEQIHGYCKTHGIEMVSHERIYQYVYQDKRLGGNLFRHLRICSKPYRKRYGSYDRRGKIPGRISIEQRSEMVNSKERCGDWEADTIFGTDHKQAILTLVERKCLFLQTVKLSACSAALTAKAMINSLAPYRPLVRSITSDNGHEFSHHQHISKKLHADYFFTHPYSAWEKGCNENMNGLIRQYIPKKTDLAQISQHDLCHVTQKLNTRPRKTLGWKTPLELFMANFKPPNHVALHT